jgi:RHS repeat-associated protein
VSQTTGGSTTNYLWDEQSASGDIVLETGGASGAVQASYALGNGQLLAQTRGTTTSYILPDGQGSIRALTNNSGAITDRARYDAFGNLQISQGTTANPYAYDGQRFDALTGLYQLRARSYDPDQLSGVVLRADFATDSSPAVSFSRCPPVAGLPAARLCYTTPWRSPTCATVEAQRFLSLAAGFGWRSGRTARPGRPRLLGARAV